MKKLLSLLAIPLVLTTLTGCGDTREKLYIINVGEYMDQGLRKDFEKEFNVKVVYEEVDSPEAMYTKITSGGTNYDIAIQSDYMVEKMISEGLLYELDKNNIPNMSNLDPQFVDKTYDPGNKYSVPYFWGTVGIMYNKDLVSNNDLTGWDVLWNPKYKNQVYMYDSVRDAFMVGLKKLNYSLNEKDETKIKEAQKQLIDLLPNLSGFGTDDIKNLIVSEDAALGVVYNGDFLITYLDMCLGENECSVGYYIPEEGTNMWIDNMIIPKTSKNKELAEKFINYMNEPENAKDNAEEVAYPTPNIKAYELMLDDKGYGEYVKLEAYYPSKDVLDKSEVFMDLKDKNKLYDKLWTEIKTK